MTSRENELKNIRPKLVKILKKNGIKKAGIFGSFARGEQRKRSDVDILIDSNASLLKLVKLEQELAKALNKKIDLLTYEGLHPLLKEKILNEEIRIL